ncbi:hypothetical protein CALCODRAFT_265541 [Calocera cornea HHB12733]|uniref:Uncharacterized protein n=1 Tax=Calocera cornea HHB12733 TaxID=1353952 RepID=A0A165GE01_9BASI|nr:hypothetical protein CALCODRAFT_265541 [Calocera cornea HHB12733]
MCLRSRGRDPCPSLAIPTDACEAITVLAARSVARAERGSKHWDAWNKGEGSPGGSTARPLGLVRPCIPAGGRRWDIASASARSFAEAGRLSWIPSLLRSLARALGEIAGKGRAALALAGKRAEEAASRARARPCIAVRRDGQGGSILTGEVDVLRAGRVIRLPGEWCAEPDSARAGRGGSTSCHTRQGQGRRAGEARHWPAEEGMPRCDALALPLLSTGVGVGVGKRGSEAEFDGRTTSAISPCRAAPSRTRLEKRREERQRAGGPSADPVCRNGVEERRRGARAGWQDAAAPAEGRYGGARTLDAGCWRRMAGRRSGKWEVGDKCWKARRRSS